MFIGRTHAKAETPILWPPPAELTHWQKLWCWEGLGAGGEADDRGWDGGMASLTQWTWVWVNSRSWWWTGRPRVLWFMESQRFGHNWVTDLIWFRQSQLKLCFRKQLLEFPILYSLAIFGQSKMDWNLERQSFRPYENFINFGIKKFCVTLPWEAYWIDK